MSFSWKSCATYAMIAAMPTLAVAQTTTTPARPTTPPGASSSAPATMPQANVPAPQRNATAAQHNQGAVTPASDARRASNIIGADVYNEQNNDVGEVHDLMVSPNGPPVAVLSVGGFLGIGERYVAVPLSELQWNTDRSRWMLHGATVDSLKARPAYTYPDRS